MTQQTTLSHLQEQVECYRRLAKLAELQHVHVRQNQTEALLEVLHSRQEVLEAIATLERAISPTKRRWGEFLDSIDIDSRQKAEQLLAETRSLLEQITLSDQHDVLVLQQRKLNLGRQIRQAVTARGVNRNYGGAAVQPSTMDIQR